MFTFNFKLDDDADSVEQSDAKSINESFVGPTVTKEADAPFAEILLDQLLDALPPLISFSPLDIPLSSGRKLTLARRDLFDARFQLMSEDDDGTGEMATDSSYMKTTESSSMLGFLDNPSDLVPGVYEGGLKTWECSLDLANYLDGTDHRDVRGKRVLEIGCGTAVPSLYLLHEMFSSEQKRSTETSFHLQDYNAAVFDLVTMPNILLAWYMSPASADYRSTEFSQSCTVKSECSSPAELPITPTLTAAFRGSLKALGISLRFFSGSWTNFDLRQCGGPYDVVLSSETIYRPESMDSLIALMGDACGFGSGDVDVQLPLKETTLGGPVATLSHPDRHPYLCLVAAKVLYFGVGGGVTDFVRAIEKPRVPYGHCRGRVDTVWEQHVGVGRRILCVKWAAPMDGGRGYGETSKSLA